MASVGIEGVTAMVKGVIYDEPAVVGFVAPLTDVDVGGGEKSVVFLHEVGHTLKKIVLEYVVCP